MLYKDNEYINECNYKIHYDCLEPYTPQTDTEFTSNNSDITIFEDEYYVTNTIKNENNKRIKLFIIKCNDDDVNIKLSGLAGSVIKKIAPDLYKYIKITNSTP